MINGASEVHQQEEQDGGSLLSRRELFERLPLRRLVGRGRVQPDGSGRGKLQLFDLPQGLF